MVPNWSWYWNSELSAEMFGMVPFEPKFQFFTRTNFAPPIFDASVGEGPTAGASILPVPTVSFPFEPPAPVAPPTLVAPPVPPVPPEPAPPELVPPPDPVAPPEPEGPTRVRESGTLALCIGACPGAESHAQIVQFTGPDVSLLTSTVNEYEPSAAGVPRPRGGF